MKFEFIVKETLGLKDYLIKYYSFSIFGYLRETKAKIFCDGKSIGLNDIVKENSRIYIDYKPITQEGNLCDKPLEIVYEDDDCIVINKPGGISTIPSRLHQNDTLFNRLKYYFKDKEVTLHFINRLDKDTSGLVLVCKNQFAACLFSKFLDQNVKEYIAVTSLPMPKDEGTIELPIKRQNGMVRMVADDGKYAKTYYKLLSSSEGYYRYKVRLYTGLTHQIRVHFAYFNAPLIGDKIYNPNSKKEDAMHLEAYYLKFYHPLKNKWIEVKIDPKF